VVIFIGTPADRCEIAQLVTIKDHHGVIIESMTIKSIRAKSGKSKKSLVWSLSDRFS